MQYGRRPNITRWHRKKVPLTVAALEKAIRTLNSMEGIGRPGEILFAY
jgi:hypothetical protein